MIKSAGDFDRFGTGECCCRLVRIYILGAALTRFKFDAGGT